MRVIATNRIVSVTADTEMPSFPASNLLDAHPKKIFKAANPFTTLQVEVAGGKSSGLAIFNTNADSVSFDMVDPNYTEWEAGAAWETDVAWNASVVTTITDVIDLDGASGASMAQWLEITAGVYVTVVLTAERNVYAGTVVAGDLQTYPGPLSDFDESYTDLSIVEDLADGSVDVEDREVVRILSGIFEWPLNTTYVDFITKVKKVKKSTPTAWLWTDIASAWWLVYGRIDGEVTATHYPSDTPRSRVSLTVKEVL